MNKKTKKLLISQEDIMKMLEVCYIKAIDGIPMVSPPIQDFANEYVKKYPTKEKAVKAMLKNQILKCTTSGLLLALEVS